MPPCGPPHGRLWGSRLPLLNKPGATAGTRAGAGVRLSLFGGGSLTACPVKQRQTVAEKQVTLQDWFIVRCEDGEAGDATDPGDPKIAVGGIYISESFERQVVRTTMIVERVKKQLLRTTDGVDVWLSGRMDVESTVANGFSLKVVQQFCTGFPAVWKPFLERCVFTSEDDTKERLAPTETSEKDIKERLTPAEQQPEQQSSLQLAPPPAQESMCALADEPICAETEEQQHADVAVLTRHGSKEISLSKTQKRRLNRRSRRNQKRRKIAEAEVTFIADEEDQHIVQDAVDVASPTESASQDDKPEQLASESACQHDNPEQLVEGCESFRNSGTEMGSEGSLTEVQASQPLSEAFDVFTVGDEVSSEAWKDAIQTAVIEVGQAAALEIQERQAEMQIKESTVEDMETHPSGKSEVTRDEVHGLVVTDDVLNKEVTSSGVIKDEEVATAKVVSSRMETRRSKTLRSAKSLTTQLKTPVIKPEKTRSRRSSILPPPVPAPVVPVSPDMVSKAFGLKTSRSGRLLVPPLAFWRNQTAVHDKDGGIIAIMDGFETEEVPDTGRYNFEPPTEKQAVRLQRKLHKAVEQLQSPSPSGKRKYVTRRQSS